MHPWPTIEAQPTRELDDGRFVKSHPVDFQELMSISSRMSIKMDRFRPKTSTRIAVNMDLGKVKRGCPVQEARG